MRPPRHSPVGYALAFALAWGAPAGEARADPEPATAREARPEERAPARSSAPEPAPVPAVAVAPAAAVADEALSAAPRPAVPERPPAPAGEPPASAGVRKLELTLPLEVEVHGRVLVDLSSDERSGWGRQLEMSSARLGLEAKVGKVKTVVEADLASDPLVEDAFVRVDLPAAARLTAGRFKAPFSERRLASSWKLPIVDRGLVDRYLVKRNGLGGRRLGVGGEVRPWGGRLEASGGLFAGDPDALAAASDAGEDWAGRVGFHATRALELGASGYRAGAGTGPAAAPLRHAAGAFANLDLGPLDVSVEGFTGRLAEGAFTAGTALLGYGVRAWRGGRLEVRPVVGAEALELRGATRAVGYGAIGGAVISWAEGLKVKLQGEWARRPGDAAPATAVSAELGTRF